MILEKKLRFILQKISARNNKMRVLKFGGKSLSSIEKINLIALKISKQIKTNQDEQLIIVVSAMGDTTCQLLKLALKVKPFSSNTNSNRELDMLLASGERVSAALLSLALQKHNIPSISFTGSQAGILTQGKHSNSSIKEIKPYRINETLQKGVIPIIAGFQGVNPITKDVTTLGRGGSDLTACALAHHYKCTAELYKAVDGIHTCDPNIVNDTKLIVELDYNFLQSLSSLGSQILHDKAADFIKKNQTLLCFLSDQTFKPLTYVKTHTNIDSFSVTCLDYILALKINNLQIPKAFLFLKNEFSDLNFKILASVYDDNDSRFLISTNSTHKGIFLKNKNIKILDDSLVAVSAVFSSSKDNHFLSEITLKLNDFKIKRFLETSKRLTFFIDQTKKKEFILKLHSILSSSPSIH